MQFEELANVKRASAFVAEVHHDVRADDEGVLFGQREQALLGFLPVAVGFERDGLHAGFEGDVDRMSVAHHRTAQAFIVALSCAASRSRN